MEQWHGQLEQHERLDHDPVGDLSQQQRHLRLQRRHRRRDSGAASDVSLDTTVAINNLTLDNSSQTLGINNGQSLYIVGTSGSGTISNDGAINVGNISGGANLYVDATSITLSGTGTVTLNNANSYIRADGVGGTANTLVNQSTIAGQGYIYDVTLNNQGTILANVSGQTLTILIAPTTNSGTFQANSGSTLYMDGTLANYSPGTSTLTGGNYNAYSGTIELSQASKSGGDVIASNAATILLDGVTAKIADGSGNDILRGFVSSNSGSLTIQNGAT